MSWGTPLGCYVEVPAFYLKFTPGLSVRKECTPMMGAGQGGSKGAFLATVCAVPLTLVSPHSSGIPRFRWLSGGELRSDPIFVTVADGSVYKVGADRGGWIWPPSGHCTEAGLQGGDFGVVLPLSRRSPGGSDWKERPRQRHGVVKNLTVWRGCWGWSGGRLGGQTSGCVTCLAGQARVWTSSWRVEFNRELFWGSRHSRLKLCTEVRASGEKSEMQMGEGWFKWLILTKVTYVPGGSRISVEVLRKQC